MSSRRLCKSTTHSTAVPRIGQCVAAGVAEHVAVYRKVEAGLLTDALYKPISVRSEWSAALGRKYEAAFGELPPQLP
jgi:hypothetical protein